jgi:hypothetical protein
MYRRMPTREEVLKDIERHRAAIVDLEAQWAST